MKPSPSNPVIPVLYRFTRDVPTKRWAHCTPVVIFPTVGDAAHVLLYCPPEYAAAATDNEEWLPLDQVPSKTRPLRKTRTSMGRAEDTLPEYAGVKAAAQAYIDAHFPHSTLKEVANIAKTMTEMRQASPQFPFPSKTKLFNTKLTAETIRF